MNKSKLIFILLATIVLVSALSNALPQKHAVLASSKAIEAYFSPDGGIRDKIIARINLSKRSIKIAIYSIKLLG